MVMDKYKHIARLVDMASAKARIEKMGSIARAAIAKAGGLL
jgi:hypothetical protein